MQDAFVKAFRKLDGFRTDAAFRPWLFTIVANEARNRRRSMSRRTSSSSSVREQPAADRRGERRRSRSNTSERRRLVAAVDELPDHHREVVALRFFAGLSESETAEVLSCPLGTAKSRLSRALDALARRARRGGGAVIDLEHALADLAEHLDYPDVGAGARSAPRPAHRSRPGTARTRALLIAAAVLADHGDEHRGDRARAARGRRLARHRRGRDPPVRRSASVRPPARHPVPGATGATPDPHAPRAWPRRARAVAFTIVTPSIDSAGALAAVDLDRRVPGGLVALSYPRFTLVEIATDPLQPPPLYKLLAGKTPTQQVTVNGEPGLWIASIHEIGYSDRNGGFATDTVRRSGPVLLWQHAGVTYRIEGLRSLAAAQAVAASLR